MKEYEYKVERLEVDSNYHEKMLEIINKSSEDGWKLISTSWIFRRDIISDNGNLIIIYERRL